MLEKAPRAPPHLGPSCLEQAACKPETPRWHWGTLVWTGAVPGRGQRVGGGWGHGWGPWGRSCRQEPPSMAMPVAQGGRWQGGGRAVRERNVDRCGTSQRTGQTGLANPLPPSGNRAGRQSGRSRRPRASGSRPPPSPGSGASPRVNVQPAAAGDKVRISLRGRPAGCLSVCPSVLPPCPSPSARPRGLGAGGVSAPRWGVKGGRGCSATHLLSGRCLSVCPSLLMEPIPLQQVPLSVCLSVP